MNTNITTGQIDLDKLKNAFLKNGFDIWLANDIEDAKSIFFDEIFTDMNVSLVSHGDSQTIESTGILNELKNFNELEILDLFGTEFTFEEELENCRKALQSDLFITSSNAITLNGQLVNMDMVGNRVAGITFGPRYVVLFIGINKVTEDLDGAIERVRNYVAPQNIKRLGTYNTPCKKTGRCHDCSSLDRICNTLVITEKSYPKGRIKIVLIKEDIGI